MSISCGTQVMNVCPTILTCFLRLLPDGAAGEDRIVSNKIMFIPTSRPNLISLTILIILSTCFCTIILYLILSLQTSRPCTLKDCELYTHLCNNIKSHIDQSVYAVASFVSRSTGNFPQIIAIILP
jgi:hypothetical protein